MKANAIQIRNVIFWAMVAFFAVLVADIGMMNRLRFWEYKRLLLAVIAVVFFALAIALLVLTVKLKEQGLRKFFFILTGASAVSIPIFVILHNLVYVLFFHGTDGDEAVFFILALLVCPALFLLGTLGSIVLLISARLKKES